jgi:hypothetical protein
MTRVSKWDERCNKNEPKFNSKLPLLNQLVSLERELIRLKKYKNNLKTDIAKQRKQIEIDNLAKIIKHKMKEL